MSNLQTIPSDKNDAIQVFRSYMDGGHILFVVLGNDQYAKDLATKANDYAGSSSKIVIWAQETGAIEGVKETIAGFNDLTLKWKNHVLRNEALAFLLSSNQEICDGFEPNKNYGKQRIWDAWDTGVGA